MRIPGRDERGRESFCQGPKVVYILAILLFMAGWCLPTEYNTLKNSRMGVVM